MKIIMVQMSDKRWTLEAMHLASALARNLNGKIVLLYLQLANNPGLLGWDIAPPTTEEQDQINEFGAVAEDYGVELWVQPMQFISLVEALGQAVELLNAFVLFAHIPQSNIPLWSRFQLWSLKRQINNCPLYTLDERQPVSLGELIPPAAVWEKQRSSE